MQRFTRLRITIRFFFSFSLIGAAGFFAGVNANLAAQSIREPLYETGGGGLPGRALQAAPPAEKQHDGAADTPPILPDTLAGAPAKNQAPAEAALTFTGQIRHRSEYDNKSGEPAGFHLLRTRLGLRAAPAPGIKAFVQVQDARLFGENNPLQGRGTLDASAPAFDLHQAYFTLEEILRLPIDIRVGRQELVYGNERLIGAVGWSNTGRTFDAGVVSYGAGALSLDIFGARLAGGAPSAASQNFYGAYAVLRPVPAHHVDAFLLFDNDTDKLGGGPDAGASRLARFTTGAYLHGGQAPLRYALEFAYQGGKAAVDTAQAARADIQAYLVSAEAGVTLPVRDGLHLSLLYTQLSADDDPQDQKLGAFNTLFATNHKFYGFMDYFPQTLPGYGLRDAALLASINAFGRATISLDLHHFTTVRAFAAAESARSLGQEADLTLLLRYNANVSLALGASAFRPGAVFRQVRSEDSSYWLYLMTSVSF